MREITSTLYRVTFGETGLCRVVECDNIQDLIKYVDELERKTVVSSVVELDIRGNTVRTPRVPIKNHPYYKLLKKFK